MEAQASSREGDQPFKRKAREPSSISETFGKPARRLVTIGGVLSVFAVSSSFLGNPAADTSGWSLDTSAYDARPPFMSEGRRLTTLSAYCTPASTLSDEAKSASCEMCAYWWMNEQDGTSEVTFEMDATTLKVTSSYDDDILLGASCTCENGPSPNEKVCKRKSRLAEYDDEEKVEDDYCLLDDAGTCIITEPLQDCSTNYPSDQPGLILPYFIIIFYCFLGLAVVCDELFVPALEIMAEKLQLSNDVAGATLMAAGGSAPELACSMYGTMAGSDVGMGTIVGSAVFNVLFVIGMCAMATPPEFAPLRLTWWPLARDCTYYLITLISLYVWFAVTSPGAIETWEAAIQFIEYLGYVYLMKNSERLEGWVKSKLAKDEKVAPAEGSTVAEPVESNFADPNADFNRPSTFRTGVYQLLTQSKPITETAGVHIVTRIKGDVNETFQQLDKNKNGYIDKDELAALFKELGKVQLPEEEVQKIYNELDVNGDGSINQAEFTTWYTGSEQRLKDDVRKIFAELDVNGTNTITKDELESMLRKLGHNPTPEEVTNIESEINKSAGDINLEDFQAWYEKSLLWKKACENAKDAEEATVSMWTSVMSDLKEMGDPEKPFGAKAMFLVTLPISFAFAVTIPDCRPPQQEGKCWACFAMSIVWIAVFSIPMVDAVAALGAMWGIPVVILGLTFLAAGTSVPDLLSSIIVAKQGNGDMAVSSSIGSNIFDVAVGLPLPWLIFNLIGGCPVCVGAGGIEVSLSILIGMVFLVIVTIGASGWQMTRGLGMVMFFMYFAFCLQDILRTYLGGGKIPC